MMDETASNATVMQRLELASNLILLRVKLDRSLAESPTPGQVALITLQGPAVENRDQRGAAPLQRPYQVTTRSNRRSLEFYVYHIPGGALSPALFAIKPKTRLEISGRLFDLPALERIATKPQILFLATGNSLFPYVDSIDRLVAADERRKWLIVQAGKTPADLLYGDRIAALSRSSANVRSLLLTSGTATGSEGRGLQYGSMEDFLASEELAKNAFLDFSPETTSIVAAGNPKMLKAVEVHFGRLHFASRCDQAPGIVCLGDSPYLNS